MSSDAPFSLVDKRQEPEPDVVRLLEEMLVRAKAGELRSIIFVGRHDHGGWATGHGGDITSDALHTLGMLDEMKTSFRKLYIDTYEWED